ncbi:MAG: DNA polymerase I [Candidatus Dadabacteria bacterium]|nr:MAG: DNA polymerase I [Candidatus Dadabacteria bacterium]
MPLAQEIVMSEKVYLVDGSGYIFRAYYGVRPLSNSKGFPTNALYGFTRMLLKLLSQAESEHVVVVFDAGKETFRNEMYSEYKANRAECPEDLVPQMPLFREISSALGLPVLELSGYEADDVIATLTERLSSAGHDVVVVSGDKDLMQLVSSKVKMWDTMRDRWFDRDAVIKKMGVAPEKVVELLGLTGDSSDNIPGLKGVGPKTAVQLIEKYGDVENIISSTKDLLDDTSIRNRKKIAAAIESDPEILRLSRKLVEVRRNVPLKININGQEMKIESLSDSELLDFIKRLEPDRERLKKVFSELEFSSLLNEFGLNDLVKDEKAILNSAEYKTVLKSNYDKFLNNLKRQKEFSFDLETTSLDILSAEIVGFAFCWDINEAWYLPVGHKNAPEQISRERALKDLAPLLTNPEIKKIGQNLKYDVSVLASAGVELSGISFDTMLASYLLNPDRGNHNLTFLAQQYLGHPMLEYSEVAGDLEDFSEVPLDKATRYAAEDAHAVWLLKPVLEEKLKELDLMGVFNEIELPLLSVLSRMERAGVLLDSKLLEKMSKEFSKELKKLEKELYELAGCEFNINSPKQLQEVLFDRLGLSTAGVKKTKTGLSTNQAMLEMLSERHPLPGLILRYRMLFKLKSTYIDALPKQISPLTGRLHTRFNQTGTATGRLSSSEPNLQNIPVQTEEGRRIRRAFIPEEGRLLMCADYSQIELRLLAELSGDKNLIQTFKDDVDIHARTAREILGLEDEDQVSSTERRIGKTINFGIIYGMSGFRLGRELGIPVGEANRYIEEYFAAYPGVKEYFARVEKEAEENGYVTTLFGRKRFLSEINASGRDRGFVVRAAINAPLQGSAADIIKLAMIRLDSKIREEQLPLTMILQIHDELMFECDIDAAEEMKEVVKKEMEGVIKLKVPLKVDLGVGPNWEEAH